MFLIEFPSNLCDNDIMKIESLLTLMIENVELANRFKKEHNDQEMIRKGYEKVWNPETKSVEWQKKED